MSVEDWRQKVSTSDGCKTLFQSKHFQTDLINALNQWHQSSFKWIQNASKHSSTANTAHVPLNKVILLYRTIRNLSSIQSHSEWIIAESNIIAKTTHFLCTIFTALYDLLSSEPNQLFLLLCDIIRAAFQMFCNLSFHSFANNHQQHSMLWSQLRSSDLSSNSTSNYIVLWMEQWFVTTQQSHAHNHNTNVVTQANVSRILEPICAFLHQFMIYHPQVMDDEESTLINKAMYHIQCVDVYYFGNNKNYLYEKVENKEEDSDSEDHTNDEFDKWKHHDYIRKLMPHFIHSNGLTFYISNLKLDPTCSNRYYFQVCIELLFEMTESILIDIKTPSSKPEVRMTQKKKIHLVRYSLHTTFTQLLTVVEFALQSVFSALLKNMKGGSSGDRMLIRMCQHILEIMSNVALISTSVQTTKDRIQYQTELMHSCGSIMTQSLDRLQNESEKLSKYCKENKVSDDTFKREYALICEMLSFRRPFVSMIATLCCKNAANQDYVREQGVIEILLNMTKIDRFTLFLQQWSIFAIKNVTTNHEANQRYIESMKAEKVLQNEEMSKLGIRITYDEITGKLVAKK